MMFTGLTVANVVGVPLGTFIGQTAGWRTTFLVVAALGVGGLLGVAKLVPEQPKAEGVRIRHELAAFRNVQVLLAMAMTVLGFGGVFAAITYITPMMTEIAGYSASSVTWLLVLFGLGMVGGNLIGGRFADRRLMPLLYVSLGALAVVLGLFTVTAHSKVAAAVTIVLIGALGFATVPPLQKRVLDQAAGAPTLASASTSGPSTSATPSPPGSAVSSSRPVRLHGPRTGSAPRSPRRRWSWRCSPASWKAGRPGRAGSSRGTAPSRPRAGCPAVTPPPTGPLQQDRSYRDSAAVRPSPYGAGHPATQPRRPRDGAAAFRVSPSRR